MLARPDFYKAIKLARFERTTARSITSADNELIGERSENQRVGIGCCKRRKQISMGIDQYRSDEYLSNVCRRRS